MAEKLYRATARGREEIPEDEATKIRAEWVKADAEMEATKYIRDRLNAYPDWREQLDQIYHEGIDAWKETIKAVKDAHPKPE
jgi:hypothetical protein